MFCDSATASELYDFEIGVIDDVLHIVVGAVEEVYIVQIEAACLSQKQELLHDYCYTRIAFKKRPVSSQQSTVKLKTGDFQREIERTNNANIAKWPTVAR